MRRQLAIREAFTAIGFLLIVFYVVAQLRCMPATEEARYTTSLLRCVDKSESLAESKACRERVDGEFGITVTVRKDAGR